MALIIYGIKNCNTMKKAFDKLAELGVDYTFFDYKKQPITEEQIQTWVNNLGMDVVMNKKGMTYRNLSDEQKQSATDKKNAVALMVQSPSLIKRPMIEYQKDGKMQYVVGYDEAKYEEIFA